MGTQRRRRTNVKERLPFREERERLGMTQLQLAQHLGVATNTVTRWEIGIHPIPKWATLALQRLRGNKKVLVA